MEGQGAQTAAMKQPWTVRATLHVSFPQQDTVLERQSKLSTFAGSCPAPASRADDIVEPHSAKPAPGLRHSALWDTFTSKHKKPHSTQNEVIKNLQVKGICSPKGKSCKDNLE